MSSHAPDPARVIALRPATAAPSPAVKEPLWRHVVGDVLRRERLAQERTLKDVADAARISMPYLSELERGRKEASSEVLAAAAHALGLGLADVLALAHRELAPAAPTAGTAGAAGAARGDHRGTATSVTELRTRQTGPRAAVRQSEVRLAA